MAGPGRFSDARGSGDWPGWLELASLFTKRSGMSADAPGLGLGEEVVLLFTKHCKKGVVGPLLTVEFRWC